MKDLRAVAPTCSALFALTVIAYFPVRDFGFVSVDDQTFVVNNPMVNGGLSLEGVTWAFGSVHSSNWMPLTWLSHMLDVQLFGMDAGAHHLVSVLLHAANAALLFAVLVRATAGQHVRGLNPVWLAAVAAALFALHPTRVESVAWIAERKDTLAVLFGLLSIYFYLPRSRNPEARPQMGRVSVAMALSLLCKPMLVTLPFVLLLLDRWPLRRGERFCRQIVEKAPLFALSALSSVVTLAAQSQTALVSLETIPFAERIGSASISVARYLGMLAWPANLGFLYPRLDSEAVALTGSWVLGSTLLVIALSALSLRVVRTQPWWIVGWLWMLGTLVPVIGLVQVGEQSIADRYTYFPAIGVFVALVWGTAAALPRFPRRALFLTSLALCVTAACFVLTRSQLPHWRDSESLWTRSIAVTEANATAHDQLGRLLLRSGRAEAALAHHRRAIELRPASAGFQHNLGNALLESGQRAAAGEAFQRALEVAPGQVGSRAAWADVLRVQGRNAKAVEQFAISLETDPGLADYQRLLSSYAKALRGEVAAHQVPFKQAAADYRHALELVPEWLEVSSSLAWIFATHPEASEKHGREAVLHAQLVLRASGESTQELDRLAAAYAAAGNFEAAIESAQQAAEQAEASGYALVAETIRNRLAEYRAGRRYVER